MHDESCELCGTVREANVHKAGHRTKLLSDIWRDGYHKVGVFSEAAGEPEFAYTVGIQHTYQHPELAIFGLDIDTEFDILDTVVDLVENGARFSHEVESAEVLDGARVVFLGFAKEHYDEYLTQAGNFYRSDSFPALLIAWPDRDGNFPWDKQAPEWLKLRQPVLWSSAPSR